MPTAQQIIDLALTQKGKPYVWATEVPPGGSPPAFDCSEFVQWVCNTLHVDPSMIDGSWLQYRHCVSYGLGISVAVAKTTKGALLFRFLGGDPLTGGRPTSAHVAFSQGNGKTIEARNSRDDVTEYNVDGFAWTHAALIPGVTYEEDEEMTITQIRLEIAAGWHARTGDWMTGTATEDPQKRLTRIAGEVHSGSRTIASVLRVVDPPKSNQPNDPLPAWVLDPMVPFTPSQPGIDMDALATAVANDLQVVPKP